MQVFPPLKSTAQKARTVEWNKNRRESRTIEARSALGEQIGFPMARQIARLLRQTKGRKNEEVCLITSLPSDQLTPRQWLEDNRQAWGIENGLHQRLDITLRDDQCRVREPQSMWILGMCRRFCVSIFMHWRSLQPRPNHKTMTDFQGDMGEDNLRKAIRFVTSKRPSLKSRS